MESLGVHRPRNVDWKRAAALLYGDWGTSKAYVIGLAFVASGFSSLPIILAVCALTALVAYNYVIVCKHFPDGGGVYSAARDQSRILAVLGALLLVADLIVTASVSAWSAMNYFQVSSNLMLWVTVGFIIFIGVGNYFGPKHSGSLAVSLAIPTVIVVVLIIFWSIPHLTTKTLEPPHASLMHRWVSFTSVILALSGVEAIANLTGVLKLDRGASMEKPRVGGEASKAIWIVALEVVVGTALLGWAMLSLPHEMKDQISASYENMLTLLGQHYATQALGVSFGKIFGVAVGVIVGLLLLSAVNTAITALIGLFYLLARDGEMPRTFARLNRHGVPWIPLVIAVVLPIAVVALTRDLRDLADLYAIGVVGAITVNLGSCSFNKELKLNWWERSVMFVTFLILFAVEITIAKTKPSALFFALCVLGVGFALRAYSQKRAGLRTVVVSEEVAEAVDPDSLKDFKINLNPGRSTMVAARGMTPVLRYALEEARLRQGPLYVLFVKEVAVTLPSVVSAPETPRWQNDSQAAQIMYSMIKLGEEHTVTIIPVYAVSDSPAGTIADLAATLGVDTLMLGSPNRTALIHLLKGNVVTEVARFLPDNIELVIHG